MFRCCNSTFPASTTQRESHHGPVRRILHPTRHRGAPREPRSHVDRPCPAQALGLHVGGHGDFYQSVGCPGPGLSGVRRGCWAASPCCWASTHDRCALALVPVMAVAAWVHAPNGWVHTSTGGGWEYPVFLTVASFALWLFGDGAARSNAARCWFPGSWPHDSASARFDPAPCREDVMKRPCAPWCSCPHFCPYVQRAAIVLAEKGVPFERRDVDLAHKPDWFLAISPLGKTPVLLVGGEAMFESAVICEYLDETALPRLHPANPLQSAQRRSWMEFGSAILNSIAAFYNATDEPLQARAAEIKARLKQSRRRSTRGRFFAASRSAGRRRVRPGVSVLRHLRLDRRLRFPRRLAEPAAWRQALASGLRWATRCGRTTRNCLSGSSWPVARRCRGGWHWRAHQPDCSSRAAWRNPRLPCDRHWSCRHFVDRGLA